MSKEPEVRLEDLVKAIDEALAQHPPLTDELAADVQRLRARIPELHRAGKVEEAKRCEKMALKIIHEGTPPPE